MRYDLIGSAMLIISALLYATKHFAAALLTSNGNDWTLYEHAHFCIGQDLTVWAGIALLFGILSLAFGILRDLKKTK